MKPLILIVLLGNCVLLGAQTSDQFSDGNFSHNPTWAGDDSLFRINASAQLQSSGTTARDICLSTPSSVTFGEWHFWCRFNLSPSTSNFMRVYLMSDSFNLKGSLNGYYVQLGGVTGSSDSITLYKQKGNTRYRIIGGRPGTVSKSNNLVMIKVLRDTDGNWQLFSDTTGGNNFVPEGTGTDNEFTNSQRLGVFVKFTASNAQQYYLDDVYAGPEIIDSLPPRMDSVQVVSATELRLVFNEEPESGSALNAANYTINNDYGHPVSVEFESGKKGVMRLLLSKALINNSYLITTNDIADLSGNRLAAQQVTFVYNVFQAQPWDVVISEFFPDPSPAIGLPEQEFIELYNNTDTTIVLQGWTISDGTSSAVIPTAIILANAYLIVCANPALPAYAQYGKTVGLASLPSLNNTYDQVILADHSGRIIHHLVYDMTWYADPLKADGGYSIEMRNPKQVCKQKQNFAASNDVKGGTPGAENSVWSTMPDQKTPAVINVKATDSALIEIVFDEVMDSLSLLIADIKLQPWHAIAGRQVCVGLHDTLYIVLAESLTANTVHEMLISGATDCSGSRIDSNNKYIFRYTVPDIALQYDVLINEIMADPDPVVALPDAEYIELYNRSDRLISLAGWTLGDAGAEAVLPDYLLQPDSFVLVISASNPSTFAAVRNTIGVDHFPNLGNDGDQLTLKNNKGYTIHHLRYTSDGYNSNLKKNGGWSLELVDEQNPCGNTQNLRASTDKSGGTPGRQNAVTGKLADHTPPQLLNVYPLSTNTVELRFNETIDSTSQNNISHFTADNGPGSPRQIVFQPPAFQRVNLVFNESFEKDKHYRIRISGIKDCAGNEMTTEDQAEFGLPEPVENNDLVINEILFDPKGDGSDFVELYHRGQKVIDLKRLYIANADGSGAIGDFYPIDTNGLLMFPGTYLVLAEDPANVRANYTVENPAQLLQCKLPSYSNTEGACLLIDLAGKHFDELAYSDKMHFVLLDHKDGVSLERISFDRPASDATNWTSASFSSGYATPTYQNSQYAATTNDADLAAEPEVFSPDGDGYNDLVHFSYRMKEPGYTGNMKIYNSAGQLQKNLLRNEILGTSGVFSWDGITEGGTKASIGIYLCYFEAFNLSGDVIRKKITTVVGGKL